MNALCLLAAASVLAPKPQPVTLSAGVTSGPPVHYGTGGPYLDARARVPLSENRRYAFDGRLVAGVWEGWPVVYLEGGLRLGVERPWLSAGARARLFGAVGGGVVVLAGIVGVVPGIDVGLGPEWLRLGAALDAQILLVGGAAQLLPLPFSGPGAEVAPLGRLEWRPSFSVASMHGRWGVYAEGTYPVAPEAEAAWIWSAGLRGVW